MGSILRFPSTFHILPVFCTFFLISSPYKENLVFPSDFQCLASQDRASWEATWFLHLQSTCQILWLQLGAVPSLKVSVSVLPLGEPLG